MVCGRASICDQGVLISNLLDGAWLVEKDGQNRNLGVVRLDKSLLSKPGVFYHPYYDPVTRAAV